MYFSLHPDSLWHLVCPYPHMLTSDPFPKHPASPDLLVNCQYLPWESVQLKGWKKLNGVLFKMGFKCTVTLRASRLTCMVSRLWRIVSESVRLALRSKTACWASLRAAVTSLTSLQNFRARSKSLSSQVSLSLAFVCVSFHIWERLDTCSWIAKIIAVQQRYYY